MDGILNINKPVKMSSFDVVRKVKMVASTKKVGHTGTLDPEASGVLPVCIGKATKLVDYIMSEHKVYKVEMKLGMVTDTYDREGKTLRTSEVNCSVEEVVSAINSFIGEIDQVPPMYSALKVNGKRLYELARQGIEIERKPRKITVYNIKILKVDIPNVEFEVQCSKGTYIRSLCYDIGEKLQCGATMWNLKRTQTGNFNINESVKIENLNKDNINDYLIPIDEALKEYPRLEVSSKFGKLLLNGVTVQDKNLIDLIENEGMYRVYIEEKGFLGIGMKKNYEFKIVKLLV